MTEMTANTEEWLKWRLEGVGASDAPIIMGKSEHKTKLQLWDQKFNKTVETEEERAAKEFICNKGHRFEAWARPHLEFTTGLTFPPAMFTHQEFPFLRASLDGYNKETNQAWECKFMGAAIWEILSNESLTDMERIPPQYLDQICQQFFVSGVNIIHLTGIKEVVNEADLKEKESYTLIINRTDEFNNYINTVLIPKLFEFWKTVQEGIRPAMTHADVHEINDKEYEDLFISFNNLTVKEKELKGLAKKESDKIIGTISKDLKKVRTKIEKRLSEHTRIECNGFKLTESPGKPSVDYKEAFDAFIGWIKQVKTLSPGEQVHSLRDFPDEPNMERYTKPGKPVLKIYIPKKKKDALAEIEAEKNANVELPDGYSFNKPPEQAPAISENFELKTSPEPDKIIKPADKLNEWKEMTPEQQTITGESNSFKNPETEKKVRGWDGKTREERIKYLRQTAKKKTTSEHGKKAMNSLADKLESLFKEPETIGGITFDK